MNFPARRGSDNYTDLEVIVMYCKITQENELYAAPERELLLLDKVQQKRNL